MLRSFFLYMILLLLLSCNRVNVKQYEGFYIHEIDESEVLTYATYFNYEHDSSMIISFDSSGNKVNEILLGIVNSEIVREKHIAYYNNGLIKTIKHFTEDKLNGIYKEYYDNGNMKIEGQYTFGEKSGKWLYFYEDTSTIQAEEFYLVPNKRSILVEFTEFDRDGEVTNQDMALEIIRNHKLDIKLRDTLCILVREDNPFEYDSIRVHFGGLNEYFHVEDSSKYQFYDTHLTEIENNELKICFTPEKRGINKLRGIIENISPMEKLSGDTLTDESIYSFFEYNYYVLPDQ